MATLTKAQTRKLKEVLSNLERGMAFLNEKSVVGIAHAITPEKTHGADYLVKNPAAVESCANTPPAITLSNKYCGSDIAGLHNALSILREFMENPECKIKEIEL